MTGLWSSCLPLMQMSGVIIQSRNGSPILYSDPDVFIPTPRLLLRQSTPQYHWFLANIWDGVCCLLNRHWSRLLIVFLITFIQMVESCWGEESTRVVQVFGLIWVQIGYLATASYIEHDDLSYRSVFHPSSTLLEGSTKSTCVRDPLTQHIFLSLSLRFKILATSTAASAFGQHSLPGCLFIDSKYECWFRARNRFESVDYLTNAGFFRKVPYYYWTRNRSVISLHGKSCPCMRSSPAQWGFAFYEVWDLPMTVPVHGFQ